MEAQARTHFMYVVRCADGTLYTGYSPDVEARVAAHNAGKGAKYTKARRPVELVASAAFASKHEAMSAEWHFKHLTRARKEELLGQAAREPLEDVLARAFDLSPACGESVPASDADPAPAAPSCEPAPAGDGALAAAPAPAAPSCELAPAAPA